jgi:hypothetical protein
MVFGWQEFGTSSRAAVRMKTFKQNSPSERHRRYQLGLWHSAGRPARPIGLAGQIVSSDWFNRGKSESKSKCPWKRLYRIQTSLVSHTSPPAWSKSWLRRYCQTSSIVSSRRNPTTLRYSHALMTSLARRLRSGVASFFALLKGSFTFCGSSRYCKSIQRRLPNIACEVMLGLTVPDL